MPWCLIRPDRPDTPWALLLVLCGTIFLEGIDVAMLAVAIPSIRADLDLSTGTAAWVMSAYILGYAGFTLLGGRAADLLGRRRMFLIWLTVFMLFSGLGGFATEGWMMIVARFVTGVSAAFMTPAAMSIITTSYEEGPQRNRALLIFAGTAAGGFSLGMVIGGLLTQLGWRWVFFAPCCSRAPSWSPRSGCCRVPAPRPRGPRRRPTASTCREPRRRRGRCCCSRPGSYGWSTASPAGR